MANGTKRDNFDPAVEFKATLDKIERPDKFAEVFCTAAKSQVSIKEVLADLVKDNFINNKEVRDSIKMLVKDVVKEDKAFFFKMTWEKVKYLFNLLLGAVIALLGAWASKKLGL